jgi:hypothetical protein
MQANPNHPAERRRKRLRLNRERVALHRERRRLGIAVQRNVLLFAPTSSNEGLDM